MKKTELKKVLKPLIKECIKEVMFEDGILSGIISEVVQGLGTGAQPIVEQKTTQPQQNNVAVREAKRGLQETRKKMLQAINSDSYNGVDVFENTTPAPSSNSAQYSALRDKSPDDAGVDLTGIMNLAGGGWKQI